MGREAASILRRKRRTDLGQGEGPLENLRGWVGESDTILLKVLSGLPNGRKIWRQRQGMPEALCYLPSKTFRRAWKGYRGPRNRQ